MKAHRAEHRVATMCRVLGVSTSGYYAWLRRTLSARAREDEELKKRIATIHASSGFVRGIPIKLN